MLGFGIKEAVDKFKSSVTSDAERFTKSYRDVGEDNPYKYIDVDEANEIIAESSGIIFVCDPNDSWCQVIAKPLTEVFEEANIETVYYLENNESNSNSNLQIESDKSVPIVIAVKDGSVLRALSKDLLIEEDYEGSPIEYYTEERVDDLKRMLEME